MKFIGFKRVKDFLAVGRDFRKGDIFHVAAVFSDRIKGEEFSFIIPLTTYRSGRPEIRVVVSESDKDIVVKTGTKNSPDHRAQIVPEVIYKKGRFVNRSFYFGDQKDFETLSKILYNVLPSGQFTVHSNNSVKCLKNETANRMLEKMAQAIKRYWV